jgi:hypothetical protein
MKKLMTSLTILAALCVSGHSQTATVDNSLLSFYMSDGSTLLKPNTEYYLGTFGTLTSSQINGLFGADTASNYSALFNNFSVLGSVRNTEAGAFGFGFMEVASPENGFLAFNGNKSPLFFNNKPMQVVVLGSVNGQNSPGNLLEIGVYQAYDFFANTAVNFVSDDAFDINSFAFMTKDSLTGEVKVGANAILGSGGTATGTSFALSALSVPEPSSASLLFIGTAGLLALRRFRKSV